MSEALGELLVSIWQVTWLHSLHCAFTPICRPLQVPPGAARTPWLATPLRLRLLCESSQPFVRREH